MLKSWLESHVHNQQSCSETKPHPDWTNKKGAALVGTAPFLRGETRVSSMKLLFFSRARQRGHA